MEKLSKYQEHIKGAKTSIVKRILKKKGKKATQKPSERKLTYKDTALYKEMQKRKKAAAQKKWGSPGSRRSILRGKIKKPKDTSKKVSAEKSTTTKKKDRYASIKRRMKRRMYSSSARRRMKRGRSRYGK